MKIAEINAKSREIVTDPEKLSEWCVEISPRKEGKLLQQIVLELKATMREHNLTSLSAPQIGYDKRVFCIKFGENNYKTFINPMIDNNSNFEFAREHCTSIPGKEFIRPRFGKIHAYYTTPVDKVESVNLAGRAAIIFQHCLDHLNGLLLEDVGLEIDELWDKATDDERAEVLKAYAESLDIKEKELKKEIAEDKELHDIDEASKFINSVKSGETKLDNSLVEN